MPLSDFQIFVKPVGATCNLSCSYCYYLEKKDLYPSQGMKLMDDNILERYIKQHIAASKEEIISFSWHGGEPLLAGIEFFRKAVAMQKKNKTSVSTIINGIQTNGTLLNDEWCDFLSKEQFVVGISLDGTRKFHDKYRMTTRSGGTFNKVIHGYELLKNHGILPEILCVVNAENVRHPLEIYEFFKHLGAKFMTFLPLVERLAGTNSEVSKSTVPALEFGVFLSRIFDEWTENDIGEIKIQIFEEAARTAFNQEHTLCIFKENCGGVPVIEHNGDFYSCDHYVNKANHLGNITNESLEYLLDSQRQQEFGLAKSLSLPLYCKNCEVRAMCNGECPKNRFIVTPDNEPGLNYLCSGYKYFFNHCRPFIEAISAAWKGC